MLLVLVDHVVVHGEPIVRVDRAFLRNQVSHMPIRGQDRVVLAEVFVDRLGLGRRFDDEQVLGHGSRVCGANRGEGAARVEQTAALESRPASPCQAARRDDGRSGGHLGDEADREDQQGQAHQRQQAGQHQHQHGDRAQLAALQLRLVGEGPAVDHQGVAAHVVQALLALGEGRHQEADAEGEAAQQHGPVATERARLGQAFAIAAHDLDADRHLAQRGAALGGMEPGVVRHADGEVDQCAGQLRDHLDGRFTTAHRAHAGAEHHTEDGADDAAGDEQHEVVDHVGGHALPEARVHHFAAHDRLRMASAACGGRRTVWRAAEGAGTGQRRGAVVDGGIVAAQVEAAAAGGRRGIGQRLQFKLVDHLAQRRPLRHAFAPDQRVQVQLAALEALADLLDRQRALALLSFGVIPLSHCMFPVGSSLEVLVVACAAAVPAAAVAVIFQPQQIAVDALARHRQCCLDTAVAVVEAADVHRRQAGPGEIARGGEAGIVGARAATFLLGEMLHPGLQRVQGIGRSGDLGAHGVVVVGRQGDGGKDGHDRHQHQQQSACDDRTRVAAAAAVPPVPARRRRSAQKRPVPERSGRVRRRRYATAAIAAGRRATPGCPGRSGCCGTTQPTVPPAAGPAAGCLLRGTTRSRGRS
ncbi:hypothetical protein G6F65_013719 [Rhizopus arrhizus]|nr:hypothetical protein G6F65_013719 [Rhizopus arrhizus]